MAIATHLKTAGPSGCPYIYEKSEFPEKKSERFGIWNIERGRYYASCAQCGAVNRFDNSVGSIIRFDRQKIYSDVDNCIVCPKCGTHFFITLEEWLCKLTEDQKKGIRIVRRGLGTTFLAGYFTSHHGNRDHIFCVTSTTKRTAYVHRSSTDFSQVPFKFVNMGDRIPCGFKDFESAMRRLTEYLKEGS